MLYFFQKYKSIKKLKYFFINNTKEIPTKMNQNNLFSTLPMDLVKCCLSYDKRYVIRKGQIITINKISPEDDRYKILQSIPKTSVRPLLPNIYASYIDSDKIVDEKYHYYIVQIHNDEKNVIMYSFRKIDAKNKEEISIKRYNKITGKRC